MSQIPTSSTLEDSSRMNKKTEVHRRIGSLPSFDNFLTKSKHLFSSSTESTVLPKSLTPSDENLEQTNHFSSDTLETVDEQQIIENSTTVIVTSPSMNSDLTAEQNDSIDPSSLSYLQTKHRRNKSEPLKALSIEDLPSLTTNESSTSNNNAKDETRRKSSSKIKQNLDEKSPSAPTPSTSKKKKAWYNVRENHSIFSTLE